jgi:hypothetical protein
MNAPGLRADIAARYQPFLDEIMAGWPEAIHSVHIVGSALTTDYNPKTSDINSVIVLHAMDLKFLPFLAPLGKKYGKKHVAAPLIMTPTYIDQSLDVFPMEFLNIKLVHHTLVGDDIFRDLDIKKADLRQECERELKVKLIGLRQGYISTRGDRKILARDFIASFAGYMPLFKAVIVLLGKTAPQNNQAILDTLAETANVDTGVFHRVLKQKKEGLLPSIQQLDAIFKDYYTVIEKLGKMINALED